MLDFIDNVLRRIVVVVAFLLIVAAAVAAVFAFVEEDPAGPSLVAVAPDGSLTSPPVDPLQACQASFNDPVTQRSFADEGLTFTQDGYCNAVLQEPDTQEETSAGLNLVPDFPTFAQIPDAAATAAGTLPTLTPGAVPGTPPTRAPTDQPTDAPPTGTVTDDRGDRGDEQQECQCQWVVNIAATPEPIRTTSYQTPDKDNPNSWFGTTHQGATFARRTTHGLRDSFGNDCPGAGGNASTEQGFLIITSKVSCVPRGCCTPQGKTKAITHYKSSIGASTSTGFCFGASNIANALSADAVQFFVDGVVIPGGSVAKLATSGSAVIGSISLGVGAAAEVGKDGPKLSGTGSLAVSASQVKADGLAPDSVYALGSNEVAKPGMVAELQTGGRTLANLSGKGTSAAEQITNLSAVGMFGVETQCGAGTFSAYSAPRTNGPFGMEQLKEFRVRFKALRDQFLP